MIKKLNNLFPIILILIISGIMISSWFGYGYLYGGGDVGLPTYNPTRILDIAKNIWWDIHAPGFPYPSALTAIPFYLMLIPLQALGLSNVVIQTIVFGSLLFLMGVGMYALFFEIVSPKSKTLSFVAAIFYMLNPYMISQVWHRFVHTTFFLSALMPILTFIYIRIIKTHSFYWYLGFLFTSFIFTYTFGSLPYMVVIWIPITVYSIWKCLELRNIKSVLEIVKIFLLLFLSWVLLNAWWLYPFWTTGPALFAEIHSIYASISTLISLSGQSTMPMVLRGINSFYVFGDGIWVRGYDQFLMQIISWTFPVVVLIGIYSILIRKRQNFYVWILLFLIGIFISKGTAAPFGYPFLWIFSESFLLGAFRNPFEKFGIIVPLASAFIFPLGIQEIYSWFKNYLSIIVILTLLILEFVVYPWPAWLGKMFGSLDQPAFIEVPDAYKEADVWINSQGKAGRILHLPFAPGDAITYIWKNGYSGIEPSQLLFKAPSISHGFGLDFLDKGLGSINTALLTDNFNEKIVADVLSSLSVRYIIVHKDVDWKTRQLIDPKKFEESLSKVDFIKKKASFGDLIVYEIDDSLFTSMSFTTEVSNVLTSSYKYFALWPEIYRNEKWPSIFITPVNENEIKAPFQTSLNYSAFPTQVIDVPFFPLAYKENALAELPRPRFLPDSMLYPLILLKERLKLFSSPILNRYLVQLDLSGKRLAEVYLLTQKGNIKLANRITADYVKEVNSVLSLIDEKLKSNLVQDSEIVILKRIFARHEIILQELSDKPIIENLKARLSKMGFIPYYDLIEDLGMSKYGRNVYRFDIKKKGEYEILLKSLENKSFYKGNLDVITLQIDNQVKTFTTSQEGNFLSLNKVILDVGLHEISYNIIDSVNLMPDIDSNSFKTTGSVIMDNKNDEPTFLFNTTKQESSTLSFPITGFDNNSVYRVDFDFWIQNGQGPILQFEQSSDWYIKGERFINTNKLFDKGNYNFYWNSASVPLQPRLNTEDAIIKFVGEPWNNCFEILKDKRRCQDKNAKKGFNRESRFVIKNISVKRPFNDDILLKSSNIETATAFLNEVRLNKVSPSLYEGELTLDHPVSFSFLTTFHPEWKLYLTKNGKTEVVSEDRHFLLNGYGNLWYLNESPGEYKIKIEFLPQKRFYQGIIVSIVGTMMLIVISFKYYRRKNV